MMSAALAAILCIQDDPWTDPLELDYAPEYYYSASPSEWDGEGYLPTWDGLGPETTYDGLPYDPEEETDL